jgi:hypothetical protein
MDLQDIIWLVSMFNRDVACIMSEIDTWNLSQNLSNLKWQ